MNAIGLVVGVIYNANAPDLYENNAHHKIGWVATWVMSAQTVVGLIRLYARVGASGASFPSIRYSHLKAARSSDEYRLSRDSGHGTEPNSPRSSCPTTPTGVERDTPRGEALREEDDYEEKHGLLRQNAPKGTLRRKIEAVASSRGVRIASVLYDITDRTILFLAFIALATGIVTYGGHFVSVLETSAQMRSKLTQRHRKAFRSSAASRISSRVEFSSGTGY